MAISDPPASELLDHPMTLTGMSPSAPSDTPFDKALGLLSVTEGDLLEITTRADARVIEACRVVYTMDAAFHSPYLAGKKNQLLRLRIAQDGKMREETIRALSSGSGVPGEFYESREGGGSGGFAFSESDD